MDHQPFDARAAFAFLDEVATRFGPSQVNSIGPAWDAVWIVCMTIDVQHETTARAALARVVMEMYRLSSASTSARAGFPTALG